MKCAIVSIMKESSEQGGFFEKLFRVNRIEVRSIEIPYVDEPVIICTIPYAMEALTQLPAKKQKKLWDRVVKILLSEGVRCVYLPETLIVYGAGAFLGEHFLLPDGRGIFCAMIPQILRKTADKQGMATQSLEIGIWQQRFDANGAGIFTAIADMVRTVTLCTEHPESVEGIVDEVYDQYGLSANVIVTVAELARCDVVILLDALPRPLPGDRTVVIDIAGKYSQACINSVLFSVPFGFLALGGYVDRFDERSIAFFIRDCGEGEDILGKIRHMGCGMSGTAYIRNKFFC